MSGSTSLSHTYNNYNSLCLINQTHWEVQSRFYKADWFIKEDKEKGVPI